MRMKRTSATRGSTEAIALSRSITNLEDNTLPWHNFPHKRGHPGTGVDLIEWGLHKRGVEEISPFFPNSGIRVELNAPM